MPVQQRGMRSNGHDKLVEAEARRLSLLPAWRKWAVEVFRNSIGNYPITFGTIAVELG